MRYILVLLFSIILVGCGFHLRGPIPWADEYKHVYMKGYNPSDRNSFFSAVSRFFPNNVEIVTDPTKADVTIEIVSERQWSRTVTGMAVDRITEEVMTLQIVIQVTATDGTIIMPPTVLMKERDFTFSESDLLGKSNDYATLTRNLRSDLAATFVRRLEALMRRAGTTK